MKILRPLLASFVALAGTALHAQSPNLIDPTFRAELTVSPDLVVPLPDGRTYVASSTENFSINGHSQHGLARLRADGSLDPTFDIGSGTDATAKIDTLDVLADGRVVIAGTFSTVNGVARPRLARLLANGALDPSFQPDAALLAPSPALRYPLLDGRWIVGTIANESLTFARFTAEGVLDSLYHSEPLDLRTPPEHLNSLTNFRGLTVSSRDRLGRQYFGTQFSSAFSQGFENFYRLDSDGRLEPAVLFRLRSSATTARNEPFSETVIEIDDHRAVIFYTSSQLSSTPVGGSRYSSLQITEISATANGRALPGESTSFIGGRMQPPTYGYLAPVMLASDGIYATAGGARGHLGIVRFDLNGKLDPEFSCEITSGSFSFLPIGQTNARLLTNGQILVRTTSLNGQRVNFLARLTPNRRAGATHLGNVSVLSRPVAGAPPPIIGYAVSNGPKNLLVRVSGPVLSSFGVTGTLADPAFTLLNNRSVFASNDDWGADSARAAVAAGAFPFPVGSRDAALVAEHGGGLFELRLTDKTGAGGATLSELYDLGPRPANTAAPRLINFSARSIAGGSTGPFVAGFTIAGEAPRNVLIRAVGPGLSAFGLTGAMRDPVIRLFRGVDEIATNANWGAAQSTGPQSPTNPGFLLGEVFRTVRAFPLDAQLTDAALSVTLAPGAYTAQIDSATNTSGTVMLEIYDVP